MMPYRIIFEWLRLMHILLFLFDITELSFVFITLLHILQADLSTKRHDIFLEFLSKIKDSQPYREK
jgi:hypothetical protein